VISDAYRSIDSIKYNYLDLPTLVKRTATNKLEMTYDADGNLLCRKVFTTSSIVPSETKDYIGNFEYINNVLDYIHTSKGD